MPELEALSVSRIVARPDALDRLDRAPGSIVLRTAPDEALLVDGPVPPIDDPWAITVDDAGWSGVWLDADTGAEFLRHACAWQLPNGRPAFAQGMVAQLPVKVWFENDRMLLVVVHTLAAELADRIERVLDGAGETA